MNLLRIANANPRAKMDSSMVESVFDDGENSDYFSPAPVVVSGNLGVSWMLSAWISC